MEIITRFKEIAQDPHAYAKHWKEKNKRKVVGSFCSYAPEEIILAAGALPYRLFGSNESLPLADAHLQAYSCSLVRGALGEALDGRLDFLDGVVFPHTCDSIQRLSDVWRMNVGAKFHTDVVLPVKLNTQSAREYMYDVLKKFRKSLGTEFGHEISDADLKTAIELMNGIRLLWAKLYDIRAANPEAISGSDLHAAIKAAMVMDRDDLFESLNQLVQSLDSQAPQSAFNHKRIILSGGVCSMPDVYRLIEEAGGAVVGDDLCTGSRYFTGQIDTKAEPIKAIGQRYLKRAICPAKHSGLTQRADNLVEMVKKTKADGVIFIILKFCDPHLFDYPYLKESLDGAGISSLFFEIEEQTSSEGQLKTRCEAFIEML